MDEYTGDFHTQEAIELGAPVLEALAEHDYEQEEFTYQEGNVAVSFDVNAANDIGYSIDNVEVDCRATKDDYDREFPNQVKGRMQHLKKSGHFDFMVTEKSWDSVNTEALDPENDPFYAKLVDEDRDVMAELSGTGRVRVYSDGDGMTFTADDLESFMDELGAAATL